MAADERTTATGAGWRTRPSTGEPTRTLALVVLWCHSEPERVGEVALLPADADGWLLGRGAAEPADSLPRVRFARQRAGENARTGPLASRGISRRQLSLRVEGRELEVERLGRRDALVNGAPAERARMHVGDTLYIEGELLLLLVERPSALPSLSHAPFGFGEADAFGVVGESAAVWVLRDRLAFVASRHEHVLIVGESGVGKELAARAIHGQSSRAKGPLVARNTATLPAGIMDAELFGNVADYPNAGMAERPGLVGAASGGTLFLDEIGELPETLQAHLLRLLDDGEFHRLGDATPQRADIRLIAATNRGESALKRDLRARLPLLVELPDLNERREDIPLLARALLRRAGVDGDLDPLLVDALTRHDYNEHVRELQALLLMAVAGSERGTITLTQEVARRLRVPREPVRPTVLAPEHIQEVLDRHGGNQTRAYRELGLSSRDALYRLIRKHGLRTGRRGSS